MFNGFFFTNTGPFAVMHWWYESFPQCPPSTALIPLSPAVSTAGERDGPDDRPTSSTFCVALTPHASRREPFGALSIR